MPPCKSRAAKRAPTLRKMTSSLSEDDVANAGNASRAMTERTDSMASRAKERSPLTDDEMRDVLRSLHNVTPGDAKIDWDALERLLADVAHLSHKEWEATGANSDKMAEILLPGGVGSLTSDTTARQMFERILHEGNWDGALEHSKSVKARGGDTNSKWAVLVTGVNGIRKTTAMYQPWFSSVLKEALIAPPSKKEEKESSSETLPNGDNSFFRQLDHMITTLCNEDFSVLYALTGAQLDEDEKRETKENDKKRALEGDPPKELIKQYSNLKASIFSRYRTLSELLGILLLKEAQSAGINAMCETSGRDIAMFHYVDRFFPDGKYNKLALHFSINDLGHAKRSVDARMVREMRTGREALATGDVVEVIYANAGGPYGSEVLEGVQADSNRVWREAVMKDGDDDGKGGGVGRDWYRAEMRIEARENGPWTIRAVRPDGSMGTEHAFGDPRTVGL
mmetsp:Transcript_42754/g.90890  ORF Transcript_42754/g.90890 Transcript_42754/m.90890 type:complete len:453 (-) Transcript_42754:518-1876(-)